MVESIDLGDNSGIGTDTIRAIGRLLHSNLVPRLMVSCILILHLTSSTLQILKLSDITITDYAYALLSQQLHNETIEELDLSYTGLGRHPVEIHKPHRRLSLLRSMVNSRTYLCCRNDCTSKEPEITEYLWKPPQPFVSFYSSGHELHFSTQRDGPYWNRVDEGWQTYLIELL